MNRIEEMKALIGTPSNYSFEHTLEFVKKYSYDDFDCELYMQANGVRPSGEVTYQRVVMAMPKTLDEKMEAVKTDTRTALQTMYDALNHGQQQKIVKNEAVKEIFDRYGVKY